MEDREVKGVFGALFVAAGFALLVFASVVVFSPERTASRAPTPMPLPAEVESLGSSGSTPRPEKDPDAEPSPESDELSTNRNERAKGMFKWNQ